ncbi:hypothetical protein [Brunnivagina elsteri]|uniref:Peptidase S1 n=1 Tax=Brunnivagina elsteri CCALA 953 TaxID=987040 RepID=A0A2A2TFY1_9CYAN|nr:hypothetical protein [Calothrix elsteri]PAX52654.1 hypothetical protein CK510_18125 [Calothrix elsteri CCALA 953]
MLNNLLNQKVKLSLVLASVLATSTISTTVQAQEVPTIFGDAKIGSKFAPDPYPLRGMSGGSISGRQIAGRTETPTGPCTGFFDEKPDHTIELKTRFEYLKLQVQSPADTTIVISGPGGSWCNDDFTGKNPGIIGEWLPGTYNVWIGSYEKNKYLPYTLQITESK